MCMQSNEYLPGRPLFKSVLLFLFSTQVKLLESLETMDKESFDTKFGGVLTYTTVSLFFEFRNIPIFQSVWADCRWRLIVVRCLWQFFSRINNWLTRQYVPTIAWRISWGYLRAHSLSLITYRPKKKAWPKQWGPLFVTGVFGFKCQYLAARCELFPFLAHWKTSHIRHHWVIKSVFILNLWSSLQLPPPPLFSFSLTPLSLHNRF